MMNPTLTGFLRKELTQALRDRRMRIVIFLIPIIQLTVFGLALSNEIRNIRLKVIADPQDVLLKRVEERALASKWFKPAHTTPGRTPFEMVKRGEAEVVVIAPAGGFSKSVGRGDPQLQVLIDATNAIRARGIESYLRLITMQVLEDLPRGPVVTKHSINTMGPILMDVRLLFNASMSTPVYMLPGVMCMVLCLITIILTSMSMAREKELGTFETLISAPITTWEILLGKTLPYVFLGLLDVPLILSVAFFGFGVPMRGSLWELALASFVFICTTVSVGTLISTYARNQQQAMMGGFLFLFPAIQLSGVMAPLDNIPLFFKILANLNPLKYFVVLMRNIMLKGGDPSVVGTNIGCMALICVVMVTLSAQRFHKKLN